MPFSPSLGDNGSIVDVAILSCSEYCADSILETLEKAVDAASFPSVKGKRILLKPNILTGAAPEKAVTTHPEFLRGAIALLKKRGAGTLYVGDSPGVGSPNVAARRSGIRRVVEEEGANWVSFKDETRVEVPQAVKQKRFFLTSILKEVDMVFTLPKMKTHGMLYFTGAVKNLFGLVPGLKKSKFHMSFSGKDEFGAMLIDLLLAVKPSYALMDGIVAMEGPGPGLGYPRELGLILASPDPLSLDWAACRIMGYRGEQIPYLKEGLQRGLFKPEAIEYPFLKAENLIVKDFKRIRVLKDTGFLKEILPPGIYGFLKNMILPRPFFRAQTCTMCNKCLTICPVDALEHGGKKKILINYQKCIRCYCCHEVCPADAVRLGRI